MQPNLALTFRALAAPTRRDVIRVLQKGPRRASDLADALHASRPAMSRHLRVLRMAGLVDARVGAAATDHGGREGGGLAAPDAGRSRAGGTARSAVGGPAHDRTESDARERIYSLAPGPFEQLRASLDEVEQFWGVQLASFKAHVERSRGKRR